MKTKKVADIKSATLIFYYAARRGGITFPGAEK
jgi:hypothetical protein